MAINFLQRLFSAGPGLDGSDIAEPGTGMPGAGLAPPSQPGISELPDAANLLQNLNPGVTPDAAPVQPDQPAASPRARRSILDTVGRLADVFAKVGGAEALYQPTLDGREDRALALGDHARTVDLDKLKLETARNAISDADRARLAQAVRGTQAILAQNPKADPAAIFTALAQRAGVSADNASAFAGQLGQDPSLLEGVAGFGDDGDKYGGSVVYAKDPVTGKVTAYQPNLKGGKARAILPDGFEAADTVKVVDTGNAQVVIDPRTGKPVNTLGKSQTPDNIANNDTKVRTTGMNNRTAVTIAGMPARSKAPTGKTDAPAARAKQATDLLDELDRTYTALDKAGAAIKPGGGIVNNVLARVRSSGAGQFVEGAVGTEAQTYRDRINSIRPSLMQSLAKATGMTGKQLDSNADVKLFMQTVTDPTKSLTANRQAIAGLRRFLAENADKTPAAPAGGTRKLPPRIGAPATAKRVAVGKPTVSNW